MVLEKLKPWPEILKFANDQGLSIEEDEDYVYLKHGKETLAVWYAEAVDIGEIRLTALRWAVVYKEKGNKLQVPMLLNSPRPEMNQDKTI